ncbi:DnaD domain protein [Enterococcus hulanensis]|uniref:DnaD domain protein n=2 Tax=Enterococcus hulanensis TaxID=2559929 RepID=A0ABU3F1J6_9ENTE|nr:DnaD domain protein [Enterococcus hulanensis]MDT2601014.1 DnaD domain protein [Enterococcus hulanensis]MDT2610504.1 DnaD domain protein [Enterococcus hulanensis]MDT2617231.1 DnaD domain protein [Enterococcus hulanensis]
MTGGWIKLYRQLLEKPIWLESSPEQKVILITLLSMANHEEKEWEWQGVPYKAKPGQFVTSLESIRKKCGKGISLQNVRTALKRFEKYEFLTNQSTKQNRLITIVNWGLYQEKNTELTDQPTVSSQTPNSQLTTNKNVKNDKNVKNIHDDGIMKEIFQLYEKTFGVLNSVNVQSIQYWCEDLSSELLVEALKRSKGSRSFKYTEGILKKWEAKGVKNMTDVKALDEEFENGKTQSRSNSQPSEWKESGDDF